MFARTLGLAVVGMALCAFGIQAGGGAKDAKDAKKDAPAKKFEVPKDAIAGTVKAVDLKANTFTIVVKDKGRTFGVDDKTEFWGPKGR